MTIRGIILNLIGALLIGILPEISQASKKIRDRTPPKREAKYPLLNKLGWVLIITGNLLLIIKEFYYK